VSQVIQIGFSDSEAEAIIMLRVQSQMLLTAGHWCGVSRNEVHISLARSAHKQWELYQVTEC
jgi:hypothetical protein